MADKKQVETSKIDALYSWISYDLKKLKGELLNEMKYSSVQVGSLYQEMKGDKDRASQALAQEIRYGYKQNQTIYDGLTQMIAEDVTAKLNAVDEKVATLAQIENAIAEAMTKLDTLDCSVALLENIDTDAFADKVKDKVAEVIPALQETLDEIKYSYLQQQAIYDGLTALISGEVISKLDVVEDKLELLQQLEGALDDVNVRLAELAAMYADNDYKGLIESVAEKTEESVAEHSRQVLEAVNAIPVAENVDYTRIVDEVGDKVLELLSDVLVEPETTEAPVADAKPVEVEIDYDKIVYGTAEKVVESLPYPEKVDYRRIDNSFVKAAESIQMNAKEDVIANAVTAAVEKAMAALDLQALANAVAEKIVVPVVEPQPIDYDRLADMVAARLTQPKEVDYDKIVAIVESNKVDNVDYEKIGAIVEEKLAAADCGEPTYNLVVDEEGVQAIAQNISQELCQMCAECAVAEEPAEEPAPVEEELAAAEEPVVEETVEETVEESAPVVEEPAPEAEDDGLVERLNRSFTAKLKQSEGSVKSYYSMLKNALTSYEKVNSNISWQGDRFNFGRGTVAKMLIRGKTLCLLLALDPADEEAFPKSTYHQKDVSDQKAHEDTPFMMKIGSNGAVKKAIRLVDALAAKLETQKDAEFAPVDYTVEYAYEDDAKLIEDGLIKKTLEKKVDFNF